MSALTIIFPALNEKIRLEKTLTAYQNYYGEKASFIVVDNGSTDGTAEMVQKKFPDVQILTFPKPLGKGGAVYAGFDSAQTPIIGFTDADGATPPEEFRKLINALTGYELAIGSRWISGSTFGQKQPFIRRVYSRLFNAFVRFLFGLNIQDTQCGAKVLRKDTYKQLKENLFITGYGFDVELLYQAQQQGFHIKEVAIKWEDKKGSGFSALRAGIVTIWDLIKLRFGI